MSGSTGIPYCTKSWNPLVGCPLPLVSDGCRFCWARDLHNKRYRAKQAGKDVKGRMYDKPFDVLQFFPELLEQPLRWKKPQTIFVCPQTDLFHPEVPFEWVDKILNVPWMCQQHNFLILTKRADRIAEYFNEYLPKTTTTAHIHNIKLLNHLGLTICNQQEADEKIPILLQIPAAHRWLSIEPMLGEIKLRFYGPKAYTDFWTANEQIDQTEIDYIVVGAESGPHARLCKLEWIESIVDQCTAAGVKVFVKQIPLNGKVVTDVNKFPKKLQRRELI